MGLEFIEKPVTVVLGSAILPVVSKGMDSAKKVGRTEIILFKLDIFDGGIGTGLRWKFQIIESAEDDKGEQMGKTSEGPG